jgi:hypothetical protein
MKTLRFLFILSFCLLTLQATAQFSLGVKAGYLRAWQEYGDVGLPDDALIHINGFQVSALAYFPISNYLEVGLEPGFAKRGAACVPGFTSFDSDTRFLLNYAELPLMISAKIPFLQNRFAFYGKTGFGASAVITGTREDITLGSDAPPQRTKMDFGASSRFNRWDYGLYGSLGFSYTMGINRLFLDVSYYNGLRDFDQFNTSKNRSLFIGLGYLAGL